MGAYAFWAIARAVGNRGALVITLTDDAFTVGDVAVRRFQVTSIRRYKELMFDGVRVDLGSERWLGILANHHEPRTLLKAFRSRATLWLSHERPKALKLAKHCYHHDRAQELRSSAPVLGNALKERRGPRFR
jgi:hypothetical protein